LKAAGLIKKEMLSVKVIKSGEINRAVNISGLRVTKGALEAINAAGGKVEE
jgi:large subunit ribosomal protein L15